MRRSARWPDLRYNRVFASSPPCASTVDSIPSRTSTESVTIADWVPLGDEETERGFYASASGEGGVRRFGALKFGLGEER